MSYARVLFIVYKVEYRNEVLGGRTYFKILNMKKLNYIGLILSNETRKSLLKMLFVDMQISTYNIEKMYLDHCTLLHVSELHGNSSLHDYLNSRCGRYYKLKITGIGVSDKAIAFKVETGLPNTRETTHITIATFNGGKPVESNYIKYYMPINPIEITGRLDKVFLK